MAPQPALGRSTVVNFKGLEKIRLVVAAGSNEWGATKIWPGSWPRGEVATPAIPLHIHALLSRILPPFSSFLKEVLSHYQIRTLHLDPSSLVLLSVVAFLCEVFVGITPSMALLRHFFSLELVLEEQCSGFASVKTTNASVPGALDAELLLKAEGFRWVSEERLKELHLRHADLEEKIQLRRATLGGPPTKFLLSCMSPHVCVDSLVLEEVEQSLEQERLEVREFQVSLAEESLASREAKFQEEVDSRVAEVQRSLLLDYRAKLGLQESRFRGRRGHVKSEVDALRKRLGQEVKHRQVALDAQATAEGKLTLLYKQVKGAASLVEESPKEASHDRGLQHERSRMFQSLERRASRALCDISGEGVSSPLVLDDAGYLGFFSRIVECLEGAPRRSAWSWKRRVVTSWNKRPRTSSATSIISTQTLILIQC
ncbi:hypothetical protein D1007_15646 [Hordeum vulgare]|nr:hypothetical protein D1007_15646 [Hordeum vulgare]